MVAKIRQATWLSGDIAHDSQAAEGSDNKMEDSHRLCRLCRRNMPRRLEEERLEARIAVEAHRETDEVQNVDKGD